MGTPARCAGWAIVYSGYSWPCWRAARCTTQPVGALCMHDMGLDKTWGVHPPQRLSCEASGLPWASIAKHCVEDGEQLAHGGGDGDLAGAVMERPNHGVVLDRRQSGHVKHAADVRPPAGDHPASAEHAAVSREGRHADEGRDAPAIESPQFGQIGDERTGGDGADPARRAEQVVGLAPGRRGAHESGEIVIETAERLLE